MLKVVDDRHMVQRVICVISFLFMAAKKPVTVSIRIVIMLLIGAVRPYIKPDPMLGEWFMVLNTGSISAKIIT